MFFAYTQIISKLKTKKKKGRKKGYQAVSNADDDNDDDEKLGDEHDDDELIEYSTGSEKSTKLNGSCIKVI